MDGVREGRSFGGGELEPGWMEWWMGISIDSIEQTDAAGPKKPPQMASVPVRNKWENQKPAQSPYLFPKNESTDTAGPKTDGTNCVSLLTLAMQQSSAASTCASCSRTPHVARKNAVAAQLQRSSVLACVSSPRL